MKKILTFLSIINIYLYNAQENQANQTTPDYSNKVGINTEQPTETLDVNGNTRIRDLINANASVDFPRIVVSKKDGTLGYKTENRVLSLISDHRATDLSWNTRNLTPEEQTAVETGTKQTKDGEQNNFNSYVIFGEDNNSTGGSWQNTNTQFSATEGDLIDINALLNFKIAENFSSTPLNTLSNNGDRQVIIYVYLKKGDELIRKVKQVVNFNGRNDGVQDPNGYESIFSPSIAFSYVVPQNGTSNDYKISVVATARAPRDGGFKVIFDDGANNLFQHLVVSK